MLLQSKFLAWNKILLCVTKKIVGYSRVGYDIMLLLAKQFFSLIGTPLQIYSKVAAYSEENSFNEEFTWVIAKWLFLSADLLGGRLFVPSAFLTLQAP